MEYWQVWDFIYPLIQWPEESFSLHNSISMPDCQRRTLEFNKPIDEHLGYRDI